MPAMIADGFGQPVCNDMPMAAPEMEQGDAAVPGGTEVLHVYSTGLNGSLPHDMPAEQSSATFPPRSVCPKSMPTRVAKLCQKGTYQGHPCAPMLSISSFADACLMTKVINAGVTSLKCLELLTPVAGSAPVWSIVSSTVLMYLHPALLSALAALMNWPLSPSRLLQVPCTFQGIALVHTLQLHWRLITVSFAGTSSNLAVRAPLLSGRLAAQSAIS